MRPKPEKPKKGQESVWDYPRPPAVEATAKRISVVFNGITIADTTRAYRVLETSHPPVYYIPVSDIAMEYLSPSRGHSFCEWKGAASYYSVRVKGVVAENAAWHYPGPVHRFSVIKDHVAFYAEKMEACYVNGEKVTPQPGGMYGGWITEDLTGPFKGIPGSWGW